MSGLSLSLSVLAKSSGSFEKRYLSLLQSINQQKALMLGVTLISLLSTLMYAHAAFAESSIKEEIAAAAEAAPAHITDEATYLIFEQNGFRTLREGTNSFTCLVIKNPQGRFEPACLNRQAMRSILPTYKLEMTLLYSGTPPQDVTRRILEAYENGHIPGAETGSLVYMMSPNNIGFNPDTGILAPTPVHQMYYFPKLANGTFSLGSEPPVRLWQGYPHLSALIVDVP